MSKRKDKKIIEEQKATIEQLISDNTLLQK